MNAQRNKEMQQLRSTEAHILQLLEIETDEEARTLLIAKYCRTQSKRRELEELPA